LFAEEEKCSYLIVASFISLNIRQWMLKKAKLPDNIGVLLGVFIAMVNALTPYSRITN
jgi:hypothetical protein